uniref:Uncharacterized protein n=1 Tax=viral metagenome TaxID=1070528 RepID=A0A6C0LFQ0_9ZZZZ
MIYSAFDLIKFQMINSLKKNLNATKCFSRYDELYSIRFKALW